MNATSATKIALAVLFAGCGPAVDEGGSDGSSSTSAGVDSSMATSMPMPSTSPPTDPSGLTQPGSSGVDSSAGDSGSSSGDLTGLSFLPGGTEDPPVAECSIFDQDCPDGEKCAPWANDGGSHWNAIKCFPIDPEPDAIGESCTVEGSAVSGMDSCDGASMCFNVDARTEEGTCYAFCTGSENNPGCPGTSQCNIAGDGVLSICVPSCDPLELDACPGSEVCVPNYESFYCAYGLGDKAAAYLDPCEFINQCEGGLFCAEGVVNDACGDDEVGCCTPFCDLDMPVCPDGTGCSSFFQEDAPEGLEHVGYCGT